MINRNFIHLFYIKSKYDVEYYFTSSAHQIHHEGKIYIPFSGVSIFSGGFNDSAQNEIILHGIFEEQGVAADQDLTNSIIKIMNFENGIANEILTYICTKQICEGLEFKLVYQPEVIKLNRSLLPVFSKTCRANFCDKDCKLDINDFKFEISVISIEGNNLLCQDLSGYESNYFSGGKLHIEQSGKQCEYLIKRHFANQIELLNGNILDTDKANKFYLSPTCDKKIRTCCYSFNNTVNFRGEPDIPEHRIIKN